MSKRLCSNLSVQDLVRFERAGAYLLFAAALWVVALLCDQSALYADNVNTVLSQLLILFSFVACLAAAAYLRSRGRLNDIEAVKLLIIFGFVLKLSYALCNHYTWYQHDAETLESSGHLSYIYRLATGHGLPESNDWQFYHPPLHHYLASVAVRVSLWLGFSLERAFENIQLLTVFYASACSVVGCKIIRALGVKGKPFVAGCALICLHPTFTILAGSINNDILTVLLTMVALLYLIKWHASPTWINTIVIAVSVGLAMMTKFSAAVIAATVGILVLLRFVVDKEYKFGKFVSQAAVFTAVVMPLGLWYQLRCMLKFDQPLGYVAPISIDNPLYCGDVSIYKRLLPDFSQLRELFCQPFGDYNLPVYTLKCSVFGEYSFGEHGVGIFLLICNFLVIALSLIATFSIVFDKHSRFESGKRIMFWTWLIQLAFFVYFNLKSPFGCTMDFRYIVLTLICGASFVAMLSDKLARGSAMHKKLEKVSYYLVAVFCGASVLYFM